MGTSALVTCSRETERGVLHMVVFTPNYALTWREIRKLNITDSGEALDMEAPEP